MAALIAMGVAAAAPPANAAPDPTARLGGFFARLVEANARGGDAAVRSIILARGIPTRERAGVLLVPAILEPRAGMRGTDLSRADLERHGARFDAASRSFARVFVPVARLLDLAADPDLRRVREPSVPMPLGGLGPNVSEAVGLCGASVLQATGVTGAGIKVAVVDMGFIGLTNAISHGELNGATVRVNLPGTQDDTLESLMDHGTAVAEHVADMAPGAEIHCIKVSDEVDLQNAADYIQSHGVRIANHSVVWINDSYYDDSGPVNSIVNESCDHDGVFWAVAAGNSAHHHWRGPWKDSNANNSLEFSGVDERLDFTQGVGTVTVFLNWNQYGNSLTNLDLYVYDKNGALVASSTDPQNGPQDPAESLQFFYSGNGTPYSLEVRRVSGPTVGLDLTLFAFTGNFEYETMAGSIMDPADAHGAFTLAAVDQAVWTQANPPTESYSSRGPTTDGRLKPDLASPDGTTSLTDGPRASFGTSFASPTTAGAAALLLQINPARTPADLRVILQAHARDAGAAGPDPVYGAGLLTLPAPAPAMSWPLMTGMSGVLAIAGVWGLRRISVTR